MLMDLTFSFPMKWDSHTVLISSRGYPRYMIGETTTIDLLNRKEVDVFLVIAADPGAHFPGGANMHLAEIPVIQIDIHWGPSTELADVVLPGTFIGVETAGTSYRMDSVPIHMKSAIDPPETCREDEWIVNELLERVKKIKEAK